MEKNKNSGKQKGKKDKTTAKKASKPGSKSLEEDKSNVVYVDQLEGEESEDDFPKAADFGQILRTAHQSGHFMFQSEKKWLEEDASLESNPNFSKFFNLDTKFLNQCILSVPFNERHTFDINYTEKEELEMLKMAEENEIKYKEMLEKSSSQPIASPKKIGKDPVKEITANVEKLDVKPEPKPSISEIPKNKDSGLQDWLDDILS